MKYILFLAYVAVTILPSEPQERDPKPTLPTALQLQRELEIPIIKVSPPTPEEPRDEAMPTHPRKTFAALMAEKTFKCRIL